ncbi:MAG: chloride channel protein [Ignavibacteria bacterium]|nr:chloride channel protein [Ignavibacteria bacterium]
MKVTEWQERVSRAVEVVEHAATRFLNIIVPAASAVTDNLKQFLRRLGKPVSTLRTFPFWIAAVIAGITAVGYAKLFHLAEQLMVDLYSGTPWILFVASPTLFLLAWWIVHRFAPEAAGSGIPQVMAANVLLDRKEQKKADRLIAPRVAIVKVLSSLLCLLGGGAIGREGPTIQISASIFRSVGKFSKRFFQPISDQAWVIAGGAAGIAAAFNTPLGGIVFTLEELMTAHFNRLRTTVISAVILAGFMAQWLLGPYLYLGFPKVGGTDLLTLPLAVLVGSASGVMGGLFSKYLLVLVRKRLALKTFKQKALLTVGSSFVVIVLAVWVDPRSVGSGATLMSALLFESGESGFLLIIARFVATIASYLSGCAGGIFAPSLAIGASIGSELARLAPPEYTNLMILMGMIGFLSSVTRAPFTSFVLVLEMTDRHSVIFPMMIAALTGYSIARTFDPQSFYGQMRDLYAGEVTPRKQK